jgi:HTH-type transcriptional regulator/antitoxin HigA
MGDNMTDAEARTPGQLITELLKARGWTNRVLAMVLGVNDPIVSKMAGDKRPVDAAMALALEDVFGVPAERFVDLQSRYDLAKAKIENRPDPKRAVRAKIYGRLPIAEMISRGWVDVEDMRDPELVESALCRFFKVNRIEDTSVFAFAAKKTDVGKEPEPAQLAWLHRVKTIASEMLIGSYSPQKVEEAISKIALLRSHPEHMERIPKILAEAGIRFVVVEGLPGGKIDGVCFWLNETTPVIGMSLRFDRIDNFLFVLRHELEHVRRRDGLNAPVIDIDLGRRPEDDLELQERIADEEAREFCVPKKDMDAFIARKAPYFSERDLLGFAKALKVHPGLVAGQLQYRTKKFTHFRAHLASIREFVLPAAEVDGWGNIHPIET